VIPAGFEPAAYGLGNRDKGGQPRIGEDSMPAFSVLRAIDGGRIAPVADARGSNVANLAASAAKAPQVNAVAESLDEARRQWLCNGDERSLRRRLLTILQQLEEHQD